MTQTAKAPSSQDRDDKATIAWGPLGQIEVLTFDLQGETFALEAAMVQEILDMAPATAVPNASPIVGGVINFRGKVIPLADLRLAFGMAADSDTIDSRIIVIEMEIDEEPTLIGLRTDKVHEVTTLAQTAAEPPPSVGMRWRADYVRQLVKRNGEFIVLPNLNAIFAPNSDPAASAHH
ncbi:MAG: chemotaxis protein CheW [Caulobacteraceae bacterium]|nr:chemotaxis protein CheW [Caulobacteraceae bacterium]